MNKRIAHCAIVLTLGLAASLARAQEDTPTTRRSTGEIRRGVVMAGSPEERARLAYERVVRKVEPSMKGDPSRLLAYIEFFKREFVEDVRTFAFDAAATSRPDGSVLLTGYAEYPEHRDSLAQFLSFLGFKTVEHQVQLLPAADLGERPFAIVKVPHAFLYDKTATPRETVSQALLGDGLFLLRATDDGHYLCHSSEGYLGYVAADDVQRVTAGEFSASQAFPRARVAVTSKANGTEVPAGAHLRVLGTSPAGVTLAVPDSGEATVPADAVTLIDEQTSLARVTPVLAAARQFLGTRYVWGGKSLAGVDCSGLIQTAFQTQGIRLPRDADQQSFAGRLVATRWHRADLRPGDTLYFLSRRGQVNHTALYLGNGDYIEAAGPGVKITSFNPASPHFEDRREQAFCFAKRLLD